MAFMTKDQFIERWASLEVSDPAKVVSPIAYKRGGSTYGSDSIRVTGSLEFIDSVISNLKSLMVGESGFTRLQVSLNEVTKDKINGEFVDLGEVRGYACSIQIHGRGPRSIGPSSPTGPITREEMSAFEDRVGERMMLLAAMA